MTLSFDLAPTARKSDPQTSKTAASKIKFGKRRLEILLAFSRYGQTGAATFEIADDLGRPRDVVSPHVVPLRALGLLATTGKTVVNPATGNQCETYRVTDKFIESTLFNNEIYNVRKLQRSAFVCRHCGCAN